VGGATAVSLYDAMDAGNVLPQKKTQNKATEAIMYDASLILSVASPLHVDPVSVRVRLPIRCVGAQGMNGRSASSKLAFAFSVYLIRNG